MFEFWVDAEGTQANVNSKEQIIRSLRIRHLPFGKGEGLRDSQFRKRSINDRVCSSWQGALHVRSS